MTEEYVYVSLSFSPVDASALGYHRHAGVVLDEALDDVSEAAMKRRRAFVAQFAKGLRRTDVAKLTPEDRADYRTIQASLAAQLDELNRRQTYKHDPGVYVGLIHRAVQGAIRVPDAPEEARAFYVVRRLEAVPATLDQARRNLVDTRGPLQGTPAELEQRLAGMEPRIPAALRAKFHSARDNAIAALRTFERDVNRLPVAASTSPNPDRFPLLREAVDAELEKTKIAAISTGTAMDFVRRRVLFPPSLLNGSGEAPLPQIAADIRARAAKEIDPPARRILRTHFGDARMTYGWILYAGQAAIEDGFEEFRPAWLHQLREAMDRNPEAVEGWRDWLRLREAYRIKQGRAYVLATFHERALAAGALPAEALSELLTGGPLPSATIPALPARRLSAE